MVTIGVDNGSTGTLGIISADGVLFQEIPTQDCLHYGKAGTITKRLDRAAFRLLLAPHIFVTTRVYIERPFTGSPMMIKSMLSAHRFFESTICTLEDLGLGYEVVDSGTWQKPLLGNVRGSAELKKASKLRGIQLYPQLADAITKHGDADGLLIAHYFHHRQPQQ
jgi:hypothetical protein